MRLSDAAGAPRLFAIFRMLAGCALAMASWGTAAEVPVEAVTLWTPGQTWAVKVDGQGYVVSEREVALGSRAARLFAEDRKRHVLVSGFIEPASRDGGATVVRQVLLDSLKRSPLPPGDVSTWESGTFACARFTSAVGGSPDFRQTSVHVYAVREQYWIDVHFSSMDTKVDLKQLASTVSIEENYKPTEQDRAAAVEPIKRLERQLTAPENLSETKWKSLAVKIAVAYGEAGQIAEARRVLQRGLVRYPGYAVFHYNMACADAQEGDADSAIANLRIAWRNRSALAANEALPNPLQDSSFATILKDSRYRQMIAEVTQSR